MFHSCFGPGDVLDLSGHGTWANTDLCEIIQDLVDALSPLQIISKGQEERVAALEAVKNTAQKHTDLENESDRKQLRDDAVAMASHTQEALAARVLAVKFLLHLQVRLRAESRDGEADWVAFYECESGHGADPFASKKLIFPRWLHPAVRPSVPRCEARLVTPSARKITLRLASQRLACSWRRFRSSANSATVRSATCNTFSSRDHAEAGCAKAGTAQFSHGQELSLHSLVPWRSFVVSSGVK